MSVQSLAFLAFLTVTVCVCRLLPKERTWVLLAASLVFYLWGGAPAALWGCGLLAALWPRNVIRQMDTFRPNWRSGLYVLAWTVWAILSFTGVVTFIYSNF